MKSGNKMKEDKFSIKTKHLFYYRGKKGFNCLIYYLIRRNDFTTFKSIAKLHDNSFKFVARKTRFERDEQQRIKKKSFSKFSINVFHPFYTRQIMHFDILSVNIWWKAREMEKLLKNFLCCNFFFLWHRRK